MAGSSTGDPAIDGETRVGHCWASQQWHPDVMTRTPKQQVTMDYRITHVTRYDYSSPASVCHNVVMLSPRETGTVRCRAHEMRIEPTPGLRSRRVDAFGNQLHLFSIEENHKALTITAGSVVRVRRRELPDFAATPAWDEVAVGVREQTDPSWMEAVPLTFDSPRIATSGAFADYARPSLTAGRPVLAAVADLTGRLHADFAYDKDATHVHTPTADAFAQRAGVCQDFAHVAVACLRSVGLPARYVSGYLRTLPPPGGPRLIGADQSHAWFAVYAGAELGWVDFDPTNACVCQTDHIAVAWGRDYDDVVPIKGVFLGGGEHELTVSVDVAPLEEEPDPVGAI